MEVRSMGFGRISPFVEYQIGVTLLSDFKGRNRPRAKWPVFEVLFVVESSTERFDRLVLMLKLSTSNKYNSNLGGPLLVILQYCKLTFLMFSVTNYSSD